MILNLGNRLNTAGMVKKGPALAITLESLLKLNQPKAFDKKTTFLQYAVNVVRRNDATLCHFKDDLTTVFVAEKLIWDHTLAELKRMESQLESVRMLALYNGSDKDRPFTSVGGDDATALSMPKIAAEEEINLLRRTSIGNFTMDACARMAAVVDEIENANASYNALLRYFGEEGKKGLQPHEVFQNISTFCRDFEAAVTVVLKTEKAQVSRPSKWTTAALELCSLVILFGASLSSCERRRDLANVLRRHRRNLTKVTGQRDPEDRFENLRRRAWAEF
jgi:hypothetical protein